MYIHQTFVFLHFPRTGGTYISRNVLPANGYKLALNMAGRNGHNGVDQIPSNSKNVPIFGLIRNPWDWYVSWHTYSKKILKLNDDFKTAIMSQFKSKPIIGYNTELYIGMYYGGNAIKQYKEQKTLPNTSAYIGKTENLQIVVQDFFQKNFQKTLTFPDKRVNTTNKNPDYKVYYDNELKEIIQQRDELIIKTYGYTY